MFDIVGRATHTLKLPHQIRVTTCKLVTLGLHLEQLALRLTRLPQRLLCGAAVAINVLPHRLLPRLQTPNLQLLPVRHELRDGRNLTQLRLQLLDACLKGLGEKTGEKGATSQAAANERQVRVLENVPPREPLPPCFVDGSVLGLPTPMPVADAVVDAACEPRSQVPRHTNQTHLVRDFNAFRAPAMVVVAAASQHRAVLMAMHMAATGGHGGMIEQVLLSVHHRRRRGLRAGVGADATVLGVVGVCTRQRSQRWRH